MKKLFFATVALILVLCGKNVAAQDCWTIVEPLVIQRGLDTSTYPQEKLDMYCQISANQFYIASEVPAGAKLFDITELHDVLTGRNISSDFVLDLSTLSYYRYNFLDFQVQDFHNTIYFSVGKGSNATYLAVRSVVEAKERTYYPEQFVK